MPRDSRTSWALTPMTSTHSPKRDTRCGNGGTATCSSRDGSPTAGSGCGGIPSWSSNGTCWSSGPSSNCSATSRRTSFCFRAYGPGSTSTRRGRTRTISPSSTRGRSIPRTTTSTWSSSAKIICKGRMCGAAHSLSPSFPARSSSDSPRAATPERDSWSTAFRPWPNPGASTSAPTTPTPPGSRAVSLPTTGC